MQCHKCGGTSSSYICRKCEREEIKSENIKSDKWIKRLGFDRFLTERQSKEYDHIIQRLIDASYQRGREEEKNNGQRYYSEKLKEQREFLINKARKELIEEIRKWIGQNRTTPNKLAKYGCDDAVCGGDLISKLNNLKLN